MDEDESPGRRFVRWWRGLTQIRKLAFSLGVIGYFGSYEYIHDFGIKHRRIAFLSVLLMMASGYAGRKSPAANRPALRVVRAAKGFFVYTAERNDSTEAQSAAGPRVGPGDGNRPKGPNESSRQ